MTMKSVSKVRGDHHTYTILKDATVFSTKFYVRRDDGKSFGSFSSRANAAQFALEKAGPGSYES